jgi:hypothetical protein
VKDRINLLLSTFELAGGIYKEFSQTLPIEINGKLKTLKQEPYLLQAISRKRITY